MKRKILIVLCLILSMLLCSCTLMPAFASDIVHESLHMPEGYTRYIAYRRDKQNWIVFFNDGDFKSEGTNSEYLRLKFTRSLAYRIHTQNGVLNFLEGKSDDYFEKHENVGGLTLRLDTDYEPELTYIYATNATVTDAEGKVVLAPSWFVDGVRQTYTHAYGFSSDQLYKHTIAELLGLLSPVMAVIVIYIAIR